MSIGTPESGNVKKGSVNIPSKTTASIEKGLQINHEQDKGTPLGTSPLLEITIQGIDHVLDDDMSPREKHDAHFLAVEDVRKATQDIRDMNARQRLGSLPLYDFSDDQILEEHLEQTETTAKEILREKLHRYSVAEEEIEKRVDVLTPYYADLSDDSPLAYGEVDPESGLILIYPRRAEVPKAFIKHTITQGAVAHEISHGAMGLRKVTEFKELDGNIVRVITTKYGLERRVIDEESQTGRRDWALLENACALMDESLVQYRMHTKGLGSLKGYQKREQFYSSVSSESVQEEKDNGDTVMEEMNAKVLAARNLGIPQEWIINSIGFIGMSHLDQMVILWKISRLLGYQDSSEAHLSDFEYAMRGLEQIERSRILGTDTALESIDRVLGENTKILRVIEDDPQPKELEIVLQMLQQVEANKNPHWDTRKRDIGEYPFY